LYPVPPYFQARTHRRKKRLSVLSCPLVHWSFRLCEQTSAVPIGRISVNFDIWDFHENLWRISKFGENRAKVLGSSLEDQSSLDIVAGDIKWP
jgi:hypothetical protein